MSNRARNIRPILLSFLLAVTMFAVDGHAGSQPYLSGHGINFATGNKYLVETDIVFGGAVKGIAFQRFYNSQSTEAGVMGYGWSCSLTERLIDNTNSITLVQKDGRHVSFASDGQGSYVAALGSAQTIARISGGFKLTLANRDVHTYNSAGRLTGVAFRNGATLSYVYNGDQVASITDSLGRIMGFTYTGGRLTGLSTPLGTFTYGYDGNGNLVSVTRPDNTSLTYTYATSGDIHNLTGVTDAAGVSLQTLTYDAQDRVITSALAGGADAMTIGYPGAMTRTVTNGLNVVSAYELEATNGVARVKSFTGPGCSSSCGDSTGSSYTYTNRQQIATATDGNGVVTASTYDAQGNRLSTTEASGTPLARATTYTYTAVNQVATITEPSVSPGQNKLTTFTYDSQGNVLTRTVSGYAGSAAIGATTTFTYDSLGRVTLMDGPRTEVDDIFTLAYYPDTTQGHDRGQLHTVTNPLGQIVTYGNYTALGKPGTVTDSTGLVTTLTYDFTGKVLTRTVGGLTTSYGYDPAGRLLTLTQPGNRTLTYTYNGDRIASIIDGLGNSIGYSYDSLGRQTGLQLHDPNQALTYSLGQAYDQAGNLSKYIYPGNAQESYGYDAVHNLVETVDPVGIETDAGYDALNRQTSIDEAGDRMATYGYDRQGNVANVTDARNHVTTYVYDDLGRVMNVTSPDTGTTGFTFDAAGNILTRTDAKNQTVSFVYDALNRPVQQTYPQAARIVLLTYDTAQAGKLSAIREEHSGRSFTYNALSQVTSETRTVGSLTSIVSYGYDAATGDLVSMTYPSGRVVTYTRNALGQVTGIQLDGSPLATDIHSLPFGPIQSATLGTVNLNRTFDQRYQINRIQAGTLDLQYTRDAAGRVTGVANLPSPTTGKSTTATISPDSNRMLALEDGQTWNFTHDANGNVVSDGAFTYTRDALNRLIQVEQNGTVIANYSYDSQNRRIGKTVGQQTIHYLYDLNNNLIAETLADGTTIREYFYLDNQPLAVQEYQTNPGLYFFINDHLGTPQQLISPTGTVVWQAAYLPYGEAKVLVNTVTNNLRFPGQYFDAETGLHYNWHRFYDPVIGRYISADPIGLDGGINLYAYTGSDPVNWVDPEGLDRYNNCRGKGSLYEFSCRRAVDWACSGSKNVSCCESEEKECLGKIDMCAPDAEMQMQICNAQYVLCISGTKSPKKDPPVKPIPVPTTPKPEAPPITTKPDKWGEPPPIKPEDYLK